MPVRYCKKCGYALCGLQSPRCPECGRGFDLGDPRSTRKRPLKRWTRWVWRAGFAVATVVLLLAAAWGWLYWDWRQEQWALADLRPEKVVTEPQLPHWLDSLGYNRTLWLRGHLGPAGFVLDRATVVVINGPRSDVSSLAHLPRLKELHLWNTRISDFAPLAQMPDLFVLDVTGGSVRDLSPLSELTKLKFLGLESLPNVTDCTPLSRLTQLNSLVLDGTPVSDLSFLRGYTRPGVLVLYATKVTDLSTTALHVFPLA